MFDVSQSKAELEMLCDFTEIFDQYRLVNPYTSAIYTLKDGKAVPTGETPCYKIWNREAPCANCISMRTCRDHAQSIKLEYLGGRVLMIMAKPVVVENQDFSLELVIDVTNSMFVQDESLPAHEQTGISELIEKVNRLSVRDAFTGLYNNAYIKNVIGGLAHVGLVRPFSILIFDIDCFKQVNDRYGHLAGDTVIQTIAAVLDKFSELPGCSVGRMGGDEYCVVFEDCTLAEAERYGEQATQEIGQHRYTGQGERFSVAVSIGVGEYTPGEEVYTFIERVDRNLYKVKSHKAAARLGCACPIGF